MTSKQTWSVATLMFLAIGLGTYWGYLDRFESSRQAYLDTNNIQVATEVDGTVAVIHVKENQAVKEGDILFELDPIPFDIAISDAKATLAEARREVRTRKAAIETAQAAVKAREIEVLNAEAHSERITKLLKKGLITKQTEQEAAAKVQSAELALLTARASLNEAKLSAGRPGDLNPKVRQAKAKLEKAKWEKEKTKIVAITDGTVTSVLLRRGQVVRKGDPQFTLKDDKEFWINADFKPSQARRIYPGQEANIKLKDSSHRVLKGEVVSTSENAKVRVKVMADKEGKLYSGLPATVKIKVKKSGSVAQQDH